jgi:AraC-like DNA-binding protein
MTCDDTPSVNGSGLAEHLTLAQTIDYFDRTATVEMRAGVDAHLRKCAPCQAMLREYRSLAFQLAAVAGPPNVLESARRRYHELLSVEVAQQALGAASVASHECVAAAGGGGPAIVSARALTAVWDPREVWFRATPGAFANEASDLRSPGIVDRAVSARRRATGPAHVAALLLMKPERAHLERSLKSRASIAFCDRVDSLIQLAEAGPLSAVVTELRDIEGVTTGQTIAQIRERFPTLPIVIFVSLEASDVHELAHVPELRATAVVIRAYDDLAAEVLAAIRTVPEHPAEVKILETVHRHAPRGLVTLFDFLAHAAVHPITVEQASKGVRVPRSTLNDQLERANLPPMERLIGWMRLLHAAWKLDGNGCTVDSVANELQFKSGSALRHMVKRYTGRTPSEIWSIGGFTYLLSQFERALWNSTRMA